MRKIQTHLQEAVKQKCISIQKKNEAHTLLNCQKCKIFSGSAKAMIEFILLKRAPALSLILAANPHHQQREREVGKGGP